MADSDTNQNGGTPPNPGNNNQNSGNNNQQCSQGFIAFIIILSGRIMSFIMRPRVALSMFLTLLFIVAFSICYRVVYIENSSVQIANKPKIDNARDWGLKEGYKKAIDHVNDVGIWDRVMKNWGE